jgi:hypothetical protein
MSGWIKWEKDLENDPRFRRMVKDLLTARNIDPRNATPLQVATHVTLLSGGLLRMWAHADTYLREDDTFDMSALDMDAYLGIPEFSSVCCRDWFEETEDGRLQLPGFHGKNSPEQREKDQTAKRVARHRAKQRNAPPLPDQTRPDQKRQDQTRETLSVAASANDGRQRVEPDPGDGVENGSKPPVTSTLRFLSQDESDLLQRTYPEGTFTSQAWWQTIKLVNEHLALGVEFERILASFERYTAQCRAEGTLPRFVRSPVTHCDLKHPLFDDPFPISPTKAEQRTNGNLDAAREAKRRLAGDFR